MQYCVKDSSMNFIVDSRRRRGFNTVPEKIDADGTLKWIVAERA